MKASERVETTEVPILGLFGAKTIKCVELASGSRPSNGTIRCALTM